MSNPTTILSVSGLKKLFGNNTAISDVSFHLAKGEVVSLLGPSGCGKTTTLRCIAGFYSVDGGEIKVSGRTIASTGVFVPPEDRRLAMVFQNYVLWPHMRTFDNIAYGLRLRRMPKREIEERVNEIMRALGLSGLAQRYPHALSGGQQQRVSVARSLVVEPDILLLDEPFSNLDAKLRVDMRQEMRSLLKRLGTTAIYVTHDQEEAMVLSDRIFLMSGGKIVQEGRPIQLYERPATRFTAEFFGVSNFLPATVTEEGLDLGSGLRVRGAVERGDFKAGDKVLVAMREDGFEVTPGTEGCGENAFGATISNRLYLGGSTQLQLESNGVSFNARVVGSAPLEWPDQAMLRLRPERVMLVPDESDAR